MARTLQSTHNTILVLAYTKHHACLRDFSALFLCSLKDAERLPEVRSAITYERSHLLGRLDVMRVYVETRFCN